MGEKSTRGLDVRLEWPDAGLDPRGPAGADIAWHQSGNGATRATATAPMPTVATRVPRSVLRLDGRPEPFGRWLRAMLRHRAVLAELARKDFRVRYKRASLGALWAGAVPVLQAAVMAFVFSRVGRFDTRFSYAVYVLAGMGAWAYASTVVTAATTSIIDSSSLTDKVWFPRAILALVPSVSNLVTLGISTVVVLVAMPIFGEPYTPRLLLIVSGAVLLIAFCAALGLLLSALDVYFRDVKFMVQAAVLVWFYVTPIIYPARALGGVGRWLQLNPLVGIVALFQRAAAGAPGPTATALLASVVATLVLLVAGVRYQRRHDRLFVDQL